MSGSRLQALLAAIGLGTVLLSLSTARASVVFSDNFDRTNSSTLGNNWVETLGTGKDALIASNRLALNATNGDDTNLYVTQSTSNFSAPWNNVLTNNTAVINWTFNLRSAENDLNGFEGEGIGFVLAADNANLTTANGYAVVLGQGGSVDPIRLVRFAGGLDLNANLTNMIVATGAAGTPGDPGSNYLSLKVTYDPTSDTFELFVRSDGTTTFADPAAGAYTSYGTLVNTTFTSATMAVIGMYGQHKDSGDSYLFDNVSVVAPEPGSAGIIGVALFALGMRRRKRAL